MAEQLGSDQQLCDPTVSSSNLSTDGGSTKEDNSTPHKSEPEDNSDQFNFIETSHASQVMAENSLNKYQDHIIC